MIFYVCQQIHLALQQILKNVFDIGSETVTSKNIVTKIAFGRFLLFYSFPVRGGSERILKIWSVSPTFPSKLISWDYRSLNIFWLCFWLDAQWLRGWGEYRPIDVTLLVGLGWNHSTRLQINCIIMIGSKMFMITSLFCLSQLFSVMNYWFLFKKFLSSSFEI